MWLQYVLIFFLPAYPSQGNQNQYYGNYGYSNQAAPNFNQSVYNISANYNNRPGYGNNENLQQFEPPPPSYNSTMFTYSEASGPKV